MSQAFKRQIFSGLFVLCAFYFIHQSEAQIKFFPKRTSSSNILRRHHSAPSTMRDAVAHPRPRPRIPDRLNSYENINLRASSSTSDIYRSISSSSINRANSPALMRGTSNLHIQAASALNMEQVSRRQNTLLQRLKPNPARITSIGNALKYGAIGAAGVGGVISISNAFAGSEKEIKNVGEDTTELSIVNTTTGIKVRIGEK